MPAQTITIKSILLKAQAQLQKARIPNSGLDARTLLGFVSSYTPEQLLLHHNHAVTKTITKKFFALIKRRINKEPIAHLIGKKEFYSFEFAVNKHVLIPRPDTETLVDVALKHFKKNVDSISILDLGTGSGCLILTLLKLVPNSKGVAVDISKSALKIARTNAKNLGLQSQVKFINKSWTALKLRKKFDLIVSNPPYISQKDFNKLMKDVRCFEPQTALKAGKDGLDCYRQILPLIKKYLKPQGICLLECGKGQHKAIAKLAAQFGLSVSDYKADLNGIPRCVIISAIKHEMHTVRF